MTTQPTITVPFHGNTLFIVNHNGEPYTPMKPIVEGMGMDWASQFTKLKQRFSKGVVEIAIPSVGGPQKMICLALRKLAGWLNTISPNKVKPEIRDKVIQYQNECDDVLYEYWTTGEVKKKSAPEPSQAEQDAYNFSVVMKHFRFIWENWDQHIQHALRAAQSPLADKLCGRFTHIDVFAQKLERSLKKRMETEKLRLAS